MADTSAVSVDQWPPFFSSFFFSSPAKEGALNVTAIATAMIAINMLFITVLPLIGVESLE